MKNGPEIHIPKATANRGPLEGLGIPRQGENTSMRVGGDASTLAEADGQAESLLSMTSPPLGARLDDPRKIDFTTIKAKLLSEDTMVRLWDCEDPESRIALLNGVGVLADRSFQIRQGQADASSTRYDLDLVLEVGGDLAVEASRMGTRWRDIVVRTIKGEPDQFANLRLAAADAAVKMAKAGYPMIQATEVLCQASRDRDRRVQDSCLEGLLIVEKWAEKVANSQGSFGRSAKVWGVEEALEDKATQGLGVIFREEIRVSFNRLADRDDVSL